MPSFTLPKSAPRFRKTLALVAAVTAAPLALAGCMANSKTPGAADGPIQVTSTQTECKVSANQVASGNLTFAVKNEGPQAADFYLLAEDGLRVIGEVENIGPGLSRNLVVTAAAGKYTTSCKPGMQGDGIRAGFDVTDSGSRPAVDANVQELLDTGTRQYSVYVKDQTDQLVDGTKAFAAAYAAGDAAKARGLYAATRMHWERIEPVAESFGDLDPKLDAREADLEPGQEWTGWHRAEKDLFPPASYTPQTKAERAAIATQLVADTEDLAQRTRTVELTADKIGNGAKELLDEVATGKVTGEEEIWSHTDLWDFQANVDGARIAFESLKPVLQQKDPALSEALEAKFAALQAGLKQHSTGEGFAYYNELSQTEVQQLAALVDALGEPLAKLTSAVVL